MTSTNTCPNCSATLHGKYCSDCGQNQQSTNRYIWVLVNEAFEEMFNWNSKAWKTTVAMFFKPGFLTTEHLANRRAQYVSPLRLYIITSIVFFLTLSLLNFLGLNFGVHASDIETQTETQQQLENSSNLATSGPTQAPSSVDPVDIADDKDDDLSALGAILKPKLLKAKEIAGTDPQRLIAGIIDTMPIVTFCLLPLYAFLLKIFFLKTKRYYAEHLILVIHNNSAFFSMYTLVIVGQVLASPTFSDALMTAYIIWSSIYLTISLKKVYRQSWLTTISKSIAIGWLNFLLTIIGIVGAILIGIVLL